MSEYPPGPYTTCRNNEAYTRVDIVAHDSEGDFGYVIAKVLPIGYPETDNVANLFAAALELLQVLRAAEGLVAHDDMDTDSGLPPESREWAWGELRRTVGVARRALA